MRRLLILFVGAGLVGAWSLAPTAPSRAPSERVRGISLGLFATDPSYDYGTMVREIADRGATDLLVVIEWSQSHRLSHDPGPGARTASDETLIQTLRQGHQAGLRVGLMPIIRLPETTTGRWRGSLDPVRPAEWMRNYSDAVVALAQLARAEGVERLIVGSELVTLQRHRAPWEALIARVRSVYDGRVVYAANWDALDLPFAASLDEIGVSAYFSLADEGERPDQATLERRWRDPLARLSLLAEQSGRPVFLAEVGYASYADAAATPWLLAHAGENVDLETQAQLFRAFCHAAAEDERLSGYYVWNWFGWGGSTDIGYTPRGKPAAAVLERCMREIEA